MFGVACADNQSMLAKPLKLEKKVRKDKTTLARTLRRFHRFKYFHAILLYNGPSHRIVKSSLINDEVAVDLTLPCLISRRGKSRGLR